MIQVLSSDEATGKMVVKAGQRFVVVTKPVSVTGTPTVGQTLTAVAPTFFQSGVAVSYQWQVGGQSVPGATGQTYRVAPADAGKAISVVATGAKAGYASATSSAAATGAGQGAPVTLAVDAPKKVKKGHKAKVTVTVSSPGLTPTGTVQVTYAGEKLKAEVLSNGTVKLRLPKKMKPGKKTLRVSYVPDSGFQAASTTVRIRITRR